MSNKLYDNIDDLLVKVVLQEATPEELRNVEVWTGESAANHRYFEDFKRIWEESRNLAVRSVVREESAWQSFRQRVGQEQAVSGPDLQRPLFGEEEDADEEEELAKVLPIAARRRSMGWMRAAAILVAVVAGGWLYYTFSWKPAQFLSVRSGAQVLLDTLPEGSVVTLNKESSIRYKRGFLAATRKVNMEGEAFFNVKTDKNKPFVVETRGAMITVLGTSFNVRTIGDSVEVIVETGMVEISKGSTTVRVGAHEKVLIGQHISNPMKEQNTDDLYNYYRTNEFECIGTPLWRLVDKLNEVYHAHIVISGSRIRELPITTTFRQESLDEIVDIISKTFGLTAERSGDEIILK